jgi:betaine-aldehyde dehydrogenase/5-carboxymethyl-2-hydroxymuconic-semialdehyde dehydrogenase
MSTHAGAAAAADRDATTADRVEVAGVAVSPDHYIGGRRVASAERFEDRSPIDRSLLAELSRAGAEDVDRAVRAAHDAFPAWGALGPAGRAPYLQRLADLIDANVERLAAVECADMAMLLRSLRARVIGRGARNYRAYADLAVAYEERDWRSNGTWNRVQRMPAGPAAVITPWNAPFMLSTWKTAPALAAGCTVVLKPAEWSPLSCSLLADLADEAGLPPGVFNVIQGIGEEAGAALVAHPLLRRVSFTGSPETGRLIGGAAAANLVPFTAELGGKNPFVVFADADLEAAARKAAGQYDDAGQVCLSGTRLLVEASVRDEFLARFDAAVDEHVLGDPRDDATTVSPMIHPEHVERVDGFVRRARESGQQILRGGRRLDGLFYEPTLIVPTSNDAEIVQREVFGPVLTLQTFRTEEEAIRLANSTEYGLAGIVYTASMGRADRVGRAIRGGTVWVNTFLVRDLTAPFGGMGISGMGREGGDHALDFYSDLKTLQIREGSVG